jgi:hypothetical protein
MIAKGAEQIEFFTRFEHGKKGPPVYFLDKVDALAFLRRLFMNAWDRSELRSLLAKVEGAVTVERLTDGEVMDLLADCLVSGRIWAVRVRLLRRSRSAKPKGYMTPLEVSRMERKPPPPAQPKKEEAKPPPPPTTEPEVSPEVAAAQAAALKQASESGASFCEQ